LLSEVTAMSDKSYHKVIILNTDESRVREITTDGINYNVLYNERNDQLLLRQAARLCCINLDGHGSDAYTHYSYVYLVVLCIVSSVDKVY
jgi:hypothetical protein